MMTFPYYFHFAGHRIHPHPVMEVIAYALGFQLYRVTRQKFPAARMPFETNLWILVGALFGALAGSKLLAFIESGPDFWAHRFEASYWLGGKTILGGLLGGWLGVEIAKKLVGVRHSTGDAFVFPLIVGMAIGRIGCFLTGLDDHTYGVATHVPWGIDFGDGISRHPTQLYDIVFLATLGIVLGVLRRQRLSASFGPPGQGWGGGFSRNPTNPNGHLFLLFMADYCSWRFFVEFLKPTWKPIGISPIQVAALCGLLFSIVRLRQRKAESFPREAHDAATERA